MAFPNGWDPEPVFLDGFVSSGAKNWGEMLAASSQCWLFRSISRREAELRGGVK